MTTVKFNTEKFLHDLLMEKNIKIPEQGIPTWFIEQFENMISEASETLERSLDEYPEMDIPYNCVGFDGIIPEEYSQIEKG